MQAVTGRL